MTANSIAFAKANEEARANKAKERELKRSNLEKEAETRRSNVAKEKLDKYKTDLTALSKAKGGLLSNLTGGERSGVLAYMAANDITGATGDNPSGIVNRKTADRGSGYSSMNSKSAWEVN